MLQLVQQKSSRLFGVIISIIIMVGLLKSIDLFANNDDYIPDETIKRSYGEWQSIVNDTLTETDAHEVVKNIIRQVFYFESFAPQVLQQTWEKLAPYHRQQFVDAITESMVKKLTAKVDLYSKAALVLKNQEVKEKVATLDYELDAGKRPLQLRVFMLKNDSGQWKIRNLKIGKNSILSHYYSYCKKVLKKYSFEYLIGELGEYGYVVLENFEGSDADALPRGWSWKSKDNEKRKPYLVRSENDNKYLEATDEGESVILGKNVKWNLRKYPYVSFKWRAHRIPEGGDERFGKTVDSAAGLYFTYKKKLGLIPESVKFVWSSTLPVGSTMIRSGIGRPWMVVAETGKDHLGEWRTYVFNLYEAYKKTFGGKPPKGALGVGILSDANSLKSFAYADYDDIRAVKEADAGSGVLKILKAE